jgi:hypothetical protein
MPPEKKQGAIGVEQERLSRRRRAEATCLAPAVVAYDVHVRDGGSDPPGLGLFPAVREALGLQKEDVGLRAIVRASQRLAQLFEAGERAGTLRMRQQDERGSPRRSREDAARRPTRGGRRSFSFNCLSHLRPSRTSCGHASDKGALCYFGAGVTKYRDRAGLKACTTTMCANSRSADLQVCPVALADGQKFRFELAGAVAELFLRDADACEDRQQQVCHRRVLRVGEMMAGREMSAEFTSEQAR